MIRFLFQFFTLALCLLTLGCGSSGTNPVPNANNGAAAGLGNGKVVLPAGFPIAPSALTILTVQGPVPIAADGSFTIPGLPANDLLLVMAGRQWKSAVSRVCPTGRAS